MVSYIGSSGIVPCRFGAGNTGAVFLLYNVKDPVLLRGLHMNAAHNVRKILLMPYRLSTFIIYLDNLIVNYACKTHEYGL